jgi:hypothetical protein
MTKQQAIKHEEFGLLLDDYRRKPSDFIKEVLGSNIWTMQSNIIDAIFKYSMVAVKTCNSTGKTYIAARIAVAYLFLYPNSIVVTTAPTWKQVTNALWREIATAVKMSKFKLTDEQVSQAGLNLGTKWYAIGVSTSTPDNMMGFHADNLIVIVDEAGGVNDLMFRGVKAITTNINNKTLLIGNPTVAGGEFWRAFEPSSMYYQMTISAFDTPNMMANNIKDIETLLQIFTPPEGVDKLDHFKKIRHSLQLPYPELIDPGTVYQRAIDWGTDSPNWSALIMGEFPSQAEQALFPAHLVRMAMEMSGIDEATGKTFAELSGWKIPDGAPEYGMDVARFGMDLNVLTPRHGGWVDEQITWNKKGDIKLDVDESADRILTIINPLDFNTRVNIDDTGLGGGLTATLHRVNREMMASGKPAHRYHIAAYNMASKQMMANPNRFADITSEQYWNLRTQFYDKAIALYYSEQLYNELVSRRWGIDKSGRIKVESKEEYKKRTGGKSPDMSDSLALAFAGGIRRIETIAPYQIDQDYDFDDMPITSGLSTRY